jgi:hypothetical protein
MARGCDVGLAPICRWCGHPAAGPGPRLALRHPLIEEIVGGLAGGLGRFGVAHGVNIGGLERAPQTNAEILTCGSQLTAGGADGLLDGLCAAEVGIAPGPPHGVVI